MINSKLLPVDIWPITPIQVQYYNDFLHRFYVVAAGRRSRKTLISLRKVLIQALKHPNHKYFLGAPTRQQAKGIFWKRLKDETKYFRAKKPIETELYITLLNGTEIHVIGLDKPARIEGQPWNGCLITEFADLKPEAWGEHIRPVLSDTNGFCILDGVPGGFNHYYDHALRACGGAIPETEPGKGAFAESGEWCYYHWFSSDVLSPSEIVAVQAELDEKTFNQEYRGQFIGFQGLAYYNFSNKNLKNCKYQKDKPVHIGMDFNVDPMTATFSHIDSNVINQFGEAYLNNSNTYEMAAHIKELFPVKTVTIYPDSTGKARESNATKTDLDILKTAGFTVRAKSANPRIKDRINAVNSKMKSMSGEITYYINPKTCPKTLNDLNRVERLPDGRENKEQEKEGLIHISSALGYMIHFLFPIRRGEIGRA